MIFFSHANANSNESCNTCSAHVHRTHILISCRSLSFLFILHLKLNSTTLGVFNIMCGCFFHWIHYILIWIMNWPEEDDDDEGSGDGDDDASNDYADDNRKVDRPWKQIIYNFILILLIHLLLLFWWFRYFDLLDTHARSHAIARTLLVRSLTMLIFNVFIVVIVLIFYSFLALNSKSLSSHAMILSIVILNVKENLLNAFT